MIQSEIIQIKARIWSSVNNIIKTDGPTPGADGILGRLKGNKREETIVLTAH